MILIAARALQPALRARVTGDAVLAFDDADVQQALAAILDHRPHAVVLERLFASTSRGTALIARLHADPRLASVEVHVVAHDSEYRRVQTRTAAPTARAPQSEAAPALDQGGTRRAERIAIAEMVQITIDGGEAVLVNLSPLGAQITSAEAVKPNQRVRISLADDADRIRLDARVVWASYELPHRQRATAQYRAGLEFISPDAARLAAFADRHARR